MKKLLGKIAVILPLAYGVPALAQMGQVDSAMKDAKEAKKAGEA